MKLYQTVLNLLFPPKCPFCEAILEDVGCCDTCKDELPQLTGTAAETNVEFCDLCVSAFFYDEKVKRAVATYKFKGAQYHHKLFAAYMSERVKERFEPIDVVTWVPLHRAKQAQRGFHQTRLLARELARLLERPAQDTLRKLRKNSAQSGIDNDAQRRANVLGVYEMLPSADVREKRVLLVDDVVTTGATLGECARILKTAGASKVYIITFAKARRNQ